MTESDPEVTANTTHMIHKLLNPTPQVTEHKLLNPHWLESNLARLGLGLSYTLGEASPTESMGL